MSPQKVDAAIDLAFQHFKNSSVVPIVYLPNSDLYIAELFWGPTGSFKDLALQLLPRYHSHCKHTCKIVHQNNIIFRIVLQLLLPHERHVYVVATSGDTGSAVIDGFSRLNEEEK